MDNKKFKQVISAKHGFLNFNLKETFRYKDLIFLFVKRDFLSKYKQTLLGPLWAIIQPVLTALIFWFAFSKIAGLGFSDVSDFTVPAFMFYFAGNICWHYFSTTVTATSSTFLTNKQILSKVYYPRLVNPVASTISGLISFAIQFCLLIILWVVFALIGGYDMVINFNLFLIIPVILELMILSLGLGLIISALTTKYRDLQMVVSFGLQLWLYASPVAYGLVTVPESIKTAYLYNPVTPIITTFRYAVFGGGFFDLKYYLISFAISVVLLFLGLILFGKVEKNFTDTI